MSRVVVVFLLVISGVSATGYPSGPSLPYFPGGDPQHQLQNGPQTGYQTGRCVTSTQKCPCPTTYFPMTMCIYCSCPSAVHSSPAGVVPLSTTTQTPTIKPVQSETVSVTKQPVTSSVTSFVTDYCMVAKNLCQSTCPDGYLVDPNDCTFCLCKKDLIAG